MKKITLCLATLTLSLFANACGSKSSSDDEAPAAAAWTNTRMQAIVTSNCAVSGCHVSGGQTPNYSGISETAMRADTTARNQVAQGIMPQGTTLSPADKATFAAFYQ
ncbi:MAG: hypothetical protein EOP07_04100 [Proteobacteria bacterium]|nr:MAG: hypothetical protein EOP07_04100 [Pseudomonadota bacterium]